MRFGRLTVISRANNRVGRDNRSRAFWSCKCDCGNQVEVCSNSLITNSTKSCGCIKSESMKMVNFIHGEANKTKENKIWHHMRSRCSNKNDRKYKNYGGRGIFVCEKWNNSYESFLEDMGRCPHGMSIHRIDNNKGYCPENCKWADSKEQANEKTTNIFIEYLGKKMTMKQWSDFLGYNYKHFHSLYRYKNKTMEELSNGRI